MAKPWPWKVAPSANFLARERGFRDFLASSFALLAREVPTAYTHMCRQLAPREVILRVDGETVALVFRCDDVHIAPHSPHPQVEIETTRATVLSVIDAEATLTEAVLDDRLLLRGRLEDLVAFHDALLTYVRGAVRAPSFPHLLRRYRQLDVAPRTAAANEC